MGYGEYPLRVPPSQALVDMLRFVVELEDSEVTSLRTDKSGSHYLRFVAFPDYIMVLMEIQLFDGRARFNDLSGDDAVAFHKLAHIVASSCAAFCKTIHSEGSVLDDFEGQHDEVPLDEVRIQSSLLVRQVTRLQGSSTAVQLEATRTLARWAKEPRLRLVIGYEIANSSDAVSALIARNISAPSNVATLQAVYPFVATLESISACPAGASLLRFLQPLQSLVRIEDCSLMMSAFRKLLRNVSERASQEAVVEVKDRCLAKPSRTHTSNTTYPCASTATSSRMPTWDSTNKA